MALYDPVNGVYRKVAKVYDPVDGVYRNVIKAYDPVGGVYRKYFGGGGKTAGTLSVGESLWLGVDGTLTEFLVVHQGNPDSALYDASCDGTWLLMKDLYNARVWDEDYDNNYANSGIHSYLNDTFLGLLDIQSAIKQVKIPYAYVVTDYDQDDNEITFAEYANGSSGLPTKIFLLSAREIVDAGNYIDSVSDEGNCLDYFSGTSNGGSKLFAYYNGYQQAWWLRSVNEYDTALVANVSNSGYVATNSVGSNFYVRPAFILDSNTPFAQADGKNIIE